MQNEGAIRETFFKQAECCEVLGSPLTARLVSGLGKRLDHTTATGRRVLRWGGQADALKDAVALRLAGALNAMVARGRVPVLAACYPPNPLPDAGVLVDAALAAIAQVDGEICSWLDLPPQTNEVARSGVLYPGMCFIAQATGLPLALFEVGASGGLNLFADRYAYQLGSAQLGEAQSGVILSPGWSGKPAPAVEPVIVQRKGCDRSPLDVADPAHRERLRAYIWPDQPLRVERINAALAIARADPPEMAAMDAADWVETEISEAPEKAVVRVLFHSIAYQYFPEDVKMRIKARMEAAGRLATDTAPLAWLAFEQGSDAGPRMTLRLWPGGKEQVLAKADVHVHRVAWLNSDQSI